jgi:glycosyltransferase involved in cell wall biosynthesis
LDRKNKILIVTYKLGTGSGVGGRRWLYLGNELQKDGYDVTFLTFEKKLPEDPKKTKTIVLNSNYPEILRAYPTTVVKKIWYRLWVKYLEYCYKGAIFDETARLQVKLQVKITELITKENYECLIFTGAPFSLLYVGATIKKQFPTIKFLCDYRDRWKNSTGYGFQNLSAKRVAFETKREIEVLNSADYITVASNDIYKSFDYLSDKSNVSILLNPVEKLENVSEIIVNNKKEKTEIVISVLGNINTETKLYWSNYFDNVKCYNKNSSLKIITQLIGNRTKAVVDFIYENKIENIEITTWQSFEGRNEKMIKSDFFLFFKNPDLADSFPTKFFDYLPYRKPMLCYGTKGEVTSEIERNNLGLVLNETTTDSDFKKGITSYLMPNSPFNISYNWQHFATDSLVKKLKTNFLEKEKHTKSYTPLVSIIIPCYNSSNYISLALESVLSQTYTNIEIICIDNNSNDNTLEILNNFQNKYPNKIYVDQELAAGASMARNKGIKMAKGEWVQFLDSDDRINPTKIEYQLQLKNIDKASLIVGNYFVENEKGIHPNFNLKNMWEALIRGKLGFTSANLWRKNIVDEVNGWDNLNSSQEYHLMFKILKQNVTIIYDSNFNTYKNNKNENSITKSNLTGNMKRFIDLRIQIWQYLKESNLLTNMLEDSLKTIVFDSVKILYDYNPIEGKMYYEQHVQNKFKPMVSSANSHFYLFWLDFIGFAYVQYVRKKLMKAKNWFKLNKKLRQ